MLNKVKIMLGDAVYSDELINLFIEDTTEEIKVYCNRQDIDKELESCIRQIVIIKLNRMNSEGLASQGFGGVSESYINGYPAEILSILNRKRKIKTLW